MKHLELGSLLEVWHLEWTYRRRFRYGAWPRRVSCWVTTIAAANLRCCCLSCKSGRWRHAKISGGDVCHKVRHLCSVIAHSQDIIVTARSSMIFSRGSRNTFVRGAEWRDSAIPRACARQGGVWGWMCPLICWRFFWNRCINGSIWCILFAKLFFLFSSSLFSEKIHIFGQ